MRKPRAPFVVALVLVAAIALAQDRVNYFNGVRYVFSVAQGGAGQVLTNDGTGDLTWETTVSPEGLWTGAVIVSTSTCPAGYTRFSSADGRVLRAAASAGDPAGADTHVHTLSGASAGQAVTITGSTGSKSPSVSGTTGSTDISHTHSDQESTQLFNDSGASSALTGVTIQSGGGSHSHGAGSLSGSSHTHSDGSLAGASHTHAVGTLATVSASNLPAYYGVILCRKD